MDITKKRDGESIEIDLNGRLDTINAPLLEKETEDLEGVKKLIFDFSGVEYISSAGLRVILKAQKTMNRQGVMRLKNVSDDVLDVFDITGFLDILTIE